MNIKTNRNSLTAFRARMRARSPSARERSAAKEQFGGPKTSIQLNAKASASSWREEKPAYRFTNLIEILGVGTDKQKARYLVLEVGQQRMVMRVEIW